MTKIIESDIGVERKIEGQHPLFGRGSNVGYTVNGVQGAPIVFYWNKVYRLNIDSPGHPWYITTSDRGAPQIDEDDGAVSNLPPTDTGSLTFRPSEAIEDESIRRKLREDGSAQLYYQCYNHPYMGGNLHLLQLSDSDIVF